MRVSKYAPSGEEWPSHWQRAQPPCKGTAAARATYSRDLFLADPLLQVLHLADDDPVLLLLRLRLADRLDQLEKVAAKMGAGHDVEASKQARAPSFLVLQPGTL